MLPYEDLVRNKKTNAELAVHPEKCRYFVRVLPIAVESRHTDLPLNL
jgi:hypothetical protein